MPCGGWSDALAAHQDSPDGIAYASRHDPDQISIALSPRADIELEVLSGPTPLLNILDEPVRQRACPKAIDDSFTKTVGGLRREAAGECSKRR